ncbi:MAG: hypothetical protein LPJ98_13280, partial [Cyclobacteriaceae bacterium]|nr:hypothetical protein [Cyclobacteriaceae bacterium]
EMSEDFHERTQIMAIAQWIGQWAWVIAPWFWVIMYEPNWFTTPEAATRQLAIWVGVIFAICAMVPAIFIRSKSTKNENFSPLTFNAIGDSVSQIIRGFKEAFLQDHLENFVFLHFLSSMHSTRWQASSFLLWFGICSTVMQALQDIGRLYSVVWVHWSPPL